jgi:acetyl/propionyl-CoA carboxylase alpha subunit
MTGVVRGPVRRLLVANRGEIASRIFATCADLGIGTVAVFADPDADAPFARSADVAVPLGGTTAAETYLDIEKIVAAARRSGADAVHPGYGFLAENADLADAVLAAGLVWVGPGPAAMRTMGSKVEAKRVAGFAGVPLPPSATLDPMPADDPTGWRAAAETVGFPLLVKASAGGGGRGMRLVRDPGELAEAVRSARREALAAFGDGTVFLERYLAGARHVEVQVVGDEHGNVTHLHERECSIQRRHQKIIEEAPSPGLDDETRAQMCAAAVALARAVAYVGAGTVEFLVVGDPDLAGTAPGGSSQRFYFLEMNTRLQVEHPVTEELTGLDLVAVQLDVAAGRAHPWTDGGYGWEVDAGFDADAPDAELDDDPDLDDDDSPVPAYGHSIEARLYAEDPAAGYLPSAGRIHLLEPGGTEVRWDLGVQTGSTVSPHFDALLAKVVASGADRGTVAARLAAALRGTRIHGVRTNRDQLVAVLESAPFLAGGTPTDFLDLFPELSDPRPPDDVRWAHLAAAVLAGVDARTAGRASRGFAPPAWRNVAVHGATTAVSYRSGTGARSTVTHVRYLLHGADLLDLVVDPPVVDAVVHRVHRRPADGPVLDLEVDGLRARYQVACYPDAAGTLVCVDGAGWSSQLVELPRFADTDRAAEQQGPASPMPGTVTAVEVAVGDAVGAGQVLVVLEAMKMEHRVTSAVDGTVTALTVRVGDAVEAHQVLATITSTPSTPTPTAPHQGPPDATRSQFGAPH